MKNYQIKIVTPLFTYEENPGRNFVVYSGKIYVVNTKKLDYILAQIKILGEMVYESLNNPDFNLTVWLNKKKLLNENFLNEISCYCLRQKDFQSSTVINFLNKDYCIEENIKNLIANYFRKIIKFNFFDSKKVELNEFVEFALNDYDLINYIFHTPNDCIAELQAMFLKLYGKEITNLLKDIDTLSISLEEDKNFNKDLYIKKLIKNRKYFYQECLIPGSVINFSLEAALTNIFFHKINAYLDFGAELTTREIHSYKKMGDERHFLNGSGKRNYDISCYNDENFRCITLENDADSNILKHLKSCNANFSDSESSFMSLLSSENLQKIKNTFSFYDFNCKCIYMEHEKAKCILPVSFAAISQVATD
ncbi:MAG: hypothetical protein PHX18_06475 [Candidatus Gastranaerophilales bacterium]|nr:hypothetical protein [Candidatus Gastranaerophilales bacterium]